MSFGRGLSWQLGGRAGFGFGDKERENRLSANLRDSCEGVPHALSVGPNLWRGEGAHAERNAGKRKRESCSCFVLPKGKTRRCGKKARFLKRSSANRLG